jgi:hypothetical protein
LTDAYQRFRNADVGLGVAIQQSEDAFEIVQVLITPFKTDIHTRRYGGPPEYAPLWAFNQSMDLIRRIPYDN